MAQKESPQMARAHSQLFRKWFNAAFSQSTLSNEPQGSRDGSLRPGPSRCSRRALRAASETGTKAGLGGCGCREIVSDVLLLRRRRRANRTAIDATGTDGDEKS